ncbi:MAG: hypothetical protein ANABAC_0323 [Anaerolineae bacterium]|nr:MAG: hypothetical protein ANABAC_0323 [Anaerolineae bacterium]
MAIISPDIPFYSGIPLSSTYPLARFLPPFFHHTASSYLKDYFPINGSEQGYILDPFGVSPFLPIELANTQAAVIVCCNNPIVRNFIRLLSLAPNLHEFQATLAEISTLRKLDNRLESFFRSLYHSVCNTCLAEIEVNAYLWERDNSSSLHRLTSKQYQCPKCGSEGFFTVTVQDFQHLQRLPHRSLIEAQAASRVVDKNDPAYPTVIESLGVYPTRALYALVTLLNKLDELSLDQRQQQILHGLLIGVFDLCNGLWAHSSKRHRPKQLSLPTQFLEMNFWKSLEKSAELWVDSIQESDSRPVFLAKPPVLPRPGQITIFPGRLRELLHSLPAEEISAVITAIPRPNQAFWTLSAIWSGWLEGKEKVKPLRFALLRKRYDWGWHCRALAAAFQELSEHLRQNTPCFALVEEYEANLLSAALIAADHAGLRLENLALRSEQGRAQIHWRIYRPATRQLHLSSEDQVQPLPKVKAQIAETIQKHIQRNLEPAQFSQIHAVALTSVVHSVHPRDNRIFQANSILEIAPFHSVSDYPNFFLNLLQETLRVYPSLIDLDENEKSLENHSWWIAQPSYDHPPVSDQIEEIVYHHLLHHQTTTFLEVDQATCNHTRTLSAPSLTLIRECLDSYGIYDDATRSWCLRKEEEPAKRSAEMTEIQNHILALGKTLGFTTQEGLPITWLDHNDRPVALWWYQHTAAIRAILKASQEQTTKIYLTLPGSRVNLLLHKIQLYPFLMEKIDRQIHIIRFRQIRWLISQPKINLPLFEEWLTTEPLKYHSSQLSLW